MLIAFSPARDATMKTYKQHTYEQRCQIYALSKTGMSQNKIAKQLKLINHAVKIKKQAEDLLRTASVSMSVHRLLMIKVEWVIGKLTW
jgi:transcriptional regulator